MLELSGASDVASFARGWLECQKAMTPSISVKCNNSIFGIEESIMKTCALAAILVLGFIAAVLSADDEIQNPPSAAPTHAPVAVQQLPKPFSMIGWQLHDYNLPKLEEAVRRAPQYGVNFLIFSHGFFWSTEGFLASDDAVDPQHLPAYLNDIKLGDETRFIRGWQKDLKHIGDLATSENIPYYLWIHEFNDVPKRFLKNGKVDMDDPGLFPFLDERYEKLLKVVPGAAGLVLTLHESDYRIFRNTQVTSRDEVPERIYRISKFFYDLLKRHNKQLILRNFFYEPMEMEYFKQALDRLPDDVISMCKDTTHEFDPFYPWDPQHGHVGNKRQIMEIDLGVEKAWSASGAYCQADYLRRAIERARETHLDGVVGRARLLWDHPFDDMHEVNLYACSRFLQNPDLSVETVLHDWAARKYPAAAVPLIASAVGRSEFINHHGRWQLENWLTKGLGAEWGDYPYYFGHVLERSRYKWTHDPADKALEEKLYHPDQATFDRLVAEKDEVVNQVHLAQDELKQAASVCQPQQLSPLNEDFRFLEDAALLQRQWIRAYFAMRMYMDDPRDEYRNTMEDALTKLALQEQARGITYGLNLKTGHRYNIDAFTLEMHWRVANRKRALAEDDRILADVRKRGDVANQ